MQEEQTDGDLGGVESGQTRKESETLIKAADGKGQGNKYIVRV